MVQFFMMMQGNLICALVESWEFDPVHYLILLLRTHSLVIHHLWH